MRGILIPWRKGQHFNHDLLGTDNMYLVHFSKRRWQKVQILESLRRDRVLLGPWPSLRRKLASLSQFQSHRGPTSRLEQVFA